MASNRIKTQLPEWALPVAIVVGVLVLAFVGYKAFTGYSQDAGPAVQVHAGMYDFRKEVQKRIAAGANAPQR